MSTSAVVFRAIEVAAKAHAGQFRKGTKVPYVVHPIGVMTILLEAGCPDEVVAAGILHDVVEDTAIALEQLQREFGDRVAGLVQAVSADKTLTWRARKEHTIHTVKTTPDADLLLLVCADKLDNIRAIHRDYETVGEALWARFNASSDDQEWYYGALAEAFETRLKTQPGLQLAKDFRTEVDQLVTRPARRPIPRIIFERRPRLHVAVYDMAGKRQGLGHWFLDELTAEIRQRRPAQPGDPDWTFMLFPTAESWLVIDTAGPHRLVAISDRLASRPLTMEEAEQILAAAYDGHPAIECLAPYDPYVPA